MTMTSQNRSLVIRVETDMPPQVHQTLSRLANELGWEGSSSSARGRG
ncbi:MAG: hypothetical protein JWP68_3307 [Modestobacter sp.]|nr:hypothetical protein [Modestobacter sp.]MCW2574199.1 hypothetical protein [Modestobacter sp.]